MFKREDHFLLHIRTVHKGEKNFKCNFCNKTFSQSSGRNTHIKSVHKKVSYNCEFCQRIFKGSDKLKQHIRFVHEGKKDNKCDLCEKAFVNKENLKKHIQNIHEGVKNYKCESCDKYYYDLRDLKIHVKRHKTVGTNVNFVNDELLSMSPKIILEKLPPKMSKICAKLLTSDLNK